MSDKPSTDISLADEKTSIDLEDTKSVPLEPIDKPCTPPPEEAMKTGKKRLREVSLEAPTLKDKDSQQPPDIKESDAPPKKNRLRSEESTVPEEGHPSRTTPPRTDSPPLSTSPPHDSKVRQIRRRVKDLNWQEAKRKKSDSGSTGEVDQQDEGPEAAVGDAGSDGKPDDDESSKSVSAKSDSDKDEVTRVGGEGHSPTDIPSGNPMEASASPPPIESKELPSAHSPEPSTDVPIQTDENKLAGPSTSRLSPDPDACQGKRRREDGDQNPREAKRITPPPEKDDVKVKAPSAKPMGFMAYASSSSPFAAAKNAANIFGSSTATATFGSTTIPKPAASPFTPAASPFNAQPPQATAPHVPTPAAVKFGSSGFGAYAAAASPFAKATASGASPFGAGIASTSKPPSRVARSKSPGRHANAFGPYTTRSGKFGVSPARSAKKLKSASSLVGPDAGDAGTGSGSTSGSGDEAGEDEPGSPTNFGDILSAKENKPDTSEEEKKVEYTEQEVTTGEEDERTEYQVRAKLFGMEPPPLSGWKERGVGTLKLNVNRKTGRDARLVLRTDGVLRLVLNTNLFKGMNFEIAQDPRYVKFGIVQDKKVVLHTLRLASVKHAEDLLEQIRAHTPGIFDSYDDEV